MNGIFRIVYYSIDEGEEGRVGYKGSGFRVRGCGAAQKIMKRRGVLIALRAVIIPSKAIESFFRRIPHTPCETNGMKHPISPWIGKAALLFFMRRTTIMNPST